MTRVAAREVLLASGAVSVVTSLCLLGAFTAGSTSAHAESPASDAHRAASSASPAESGNVGGSGRSVWFQLTDQAMTPMSRFFSADGLAPAAQLADATPASGLASSAPSPISTSTPAATQPRPAVAAPPVQTRARSVTLAATSDPRGIAQALAATHGWNGAQWQCLDSLWQRESHYETTVRNPSSGAYGIPQALPASKMATAGSDWRSNPITQIKWGLGYIGDRYGSPCNAWSYWLRHDSY